MDGTHSSCEVRHIARVYKLVEFKLSVLRKIKR